MRFKSTFTNRAGTRMGYCDVCGDNEKAVLSHLTMKKREPVYECLHCRQSKEAAAQKKARTKKNRTRKDPSSIRNIETERSLKTSELRILLRAELSRVVRERDGLRCYVTGQVCPPAAYGPGSGACAHLIPIDQLPFALKYDPRVCVWMECGVHADFDGRTHYGRKAANQAHVWGLVAKRDPELFEMLTNLPRSRGAEKVSIADLREQLELLRGM